MNPERILATSSAFSYKLKNSLSLTYSWSVAT